MTILILVPLLGLGSLVAHADSLFGSPKIPQYFPSQTPVIKYSVYTPIADCITSIYTEKLTALLKRWPRPEIPSNPGKLHPIWMRAVRDPENSFHVGIIKRMVVKAPLQRLEYTVDHLGDYYSIFPSLKQVSIDQIDANRFETSWEHRSPMFFLPNARYQQSYVIDKSNPKRLIYRYQLKKANVIEHTDGFFVLESLDENTSMLTGYDFFMPDMGLLKILGSSVVWRNGTEGSFKGDLSIKLKTEHPQWSAEKIQTETELLLEKYPQHPLIDIESGPLAPPPPPKPESKSTPTPTPEPSPSASSSPSVSSVPMAAPASTSDLTPPPAVPTPPATQQSP